MSAPEPGAVDAAEPPTVRISGNLEVQRNARDAEIHAKVVEIKAHVEAYHRGYGRGGEGDFSQL